MKVCGKFLRLLQKLWQIYIYTKNSPETIGPSFIHKVLIIFMYCASIMCALYMAFIIILHQPVFRTIHERSQGTYFEVPSAILCPGKNQIYNYSFLYVEKQISKLGLPIEAVNILAKADKEDALDSSQTAAALHPHIKGLKNVNNMKPKEMWRKIISWMYYNPGMYLEKARILNKKFHKTSVDIDCSQGKKQMFENYFSCTLVRGIWLNNNNYCLIWNNTGRKVQVDQKSYEVQIVPKFAKASHTESYYFWVGNLLTDNIVFDEASVRNKEDSSFLRYKITSYKIYAAKDTVCQSQIHKSCSSYVPYKLNTHWVYVKSKERQTSKVGKVKFLINIGVSWFQVKHVNRLSWLAIFEVLGSLLGIWVGLSIMTLVKTALVVMKKLMKTKNRVIILIEIAAVMILVCCTAILQIWKYSYLQKSRFIYHLDVKTKGGTPYPDVHFCMDKLAGFNLSEIKKYKISYPLLTYITSTAILHYPAQHIDFETLSTEPSLRKKKKKKFFLYDTKAPHEVGYHWNFMQFPLQYIRENLYEEHMRKIEIEYESLCKKLGIDPSEPSWNVMKKLLLDPCRVVKFCFINDEFMESCCTYFRNVVVGQVEQYHACWLFHNENVHLRQTHPGKYHGLIVYVDADEMAHAMPDMWLDDYLHEYMLNHSTLYKWRSMQKIGPSPRYLFLKIIFNNIDTIFSPVRIQINSVRNLANRMHKKYFELTLTKNLHLHYHKKHCSYQKQPLNLFQYFKQEILFKKCGCYVCHDPPVYYTQKMPCCTPKVAGRCITQKDMYESRCYENGSFNHQFYRGINLWQYRYGGNLPIEAPVNFMVHGEYPCTMKALFSEGSKFHELYQQFLNKRSELMKQPCNFLSLKVDHGRRGNYRRHVLEIIKRNMSAVWPSRKYNWHLTFYYAVPVYLEFQERDLQNFWELFGLFCGALALCLGLTYMSVAESLITGSDKAFKFLKQETNSESIADAFSNYTLSKFRNRLEHMWQHPQTTTVEIISLKNNLNVQCLEEHNETENSTSVKKVKARQNLHSESIQNKNARFPTVYDITKCHELDDDGERRPQKDQSVPAIFPSTAEEHEENKDSKKALEAMPGSQPTEPELFCSAAEQCEENTSSKGAAGTAGESKSVTLEQNTQTKLLLDALCCTLLLSAISFTLLFCIQLQQSMKADELIVHFDLKDTNISPPTVGICIAEGSAKRKMKQEKNFAVSPNKLLQLLQKCHLQSKPVSCQKLFTFFTWNWQYECIFTNYNHFDIKGSQLQQNDLEVEVGSLEDAITPGGYARMPISVVWAGDMKTVYNGILSPEHHLEKVYKSAAYIKYQQWQVIDSADCEDHLNVLCPMCDQLSLQINTSFCCIREMYLNFNISAPQVKHCSTSFYEISYSTHKAYEGGQGESKTVLIVSSEAHVKRVITREQRRTRSEQLMLYVGYFDLFVGINVDNVITVLTTIIKRLLVWITSTYVL